MATEERLVTVATFGSVAKADSVASLLRGHGIECMLENEHLVSWFPHGASGMAEVKLLVKESEAQTAKKVLEQFAF